MWVTRPLRLCSTICFKLPLTLRGFHHVHTWTGAQVNKVAGEMRSFLTSPTNTVWAQASLHEPLRLPMDLGGLLPSKSKEEGAHCWNQRHRALLLLSLPPRVVLYLGPQVSKLWPTSSKTWTLNLSIMIKSMNTSFKKDIKIFKNHVESTSELLLRITGSSSWPTCKEWRDWCTSNKAYKEVLPSVRPTPV